MTLFDTRWRDRYGNPPPARTTPEPALPPQGQAVVDQLLSHRSVRAFADTPLAPGTLELLVAAAQSAASSSNLQAWSVVAVEDAARKARFAEWANQQAHIRQAPLFLVWLADLSRLDRIAQRAGTQVDAHRYVETFLVAAIDAALAAQNAVTAAEALGLGTVYIGALRNRPLAVSAELHLPQRVFPLFGLCVGHPDPSRPASVKPRLAQAAVLHREAYRGHADAAEAQAVSDYDELIQAFQRSQSLPPVPWSQQATQRVAGAGSLSGRHRLAEAVRAQGFALE